MTSLLHTPRSVLVTGGAGFIGSNFVAHVLATDPTVRIVTLDALTYAGSLDNLRTELDNPRHTFVHGDITDASLVRKVFTEEAIDTVLHFAAESHVDRSITGPAAFIETNVVGTLTLLEAARSAWERSGRWEPGVRFHHVSTDEVFGSLGMDDPPFSESSPYSPNSPYSASKAASDHLVRAYHHTYGLPITITNCSNNYGPHQHPEKFIPTVIRSALSEKPIPIYGAGLNVRDWLYVTDHCVAIDRVVRAGNDGETYLVGGRSERRNIDIARQICSLLDARAPQSSGSYLDLLTYVTDRLGHDFRYAIDSKHIESALGWRAAETFESGIEKTIDWYLANRAQLERAH
ncbi:MAG TPA: dTDP-glucose 4,6-dehydratase [Gemmatimonadaceae bacterium]|nr:dTDP-glucose 4,6-dehydratase [Gemmatimonadaceae bacterium]